MFFFVPVPHFLHPLLSSSIGFSSPPEKAYTILKFWGEKTLENCKVLSTSTLSISLRLKLKLVKTKETTFEDLTPKVRKENINSKKLLQ